MSTELKLIGDMLILVEEDPGSPSAGSPAAIEALEDAIRVRKMIEALESGAISEARFAEWVCLREATA
jgi:hypothetical protein